MSSNKLSILNDLKADETESLLESCAQIQRKCAQVGFDWPSAEPCFDKVDEELAEIKEALANPEKTHKDVVDEVGDLLFASINLCRHLNVSPDLALKHAQQKFVQRFQLVETMINNAGEDISQLNLAELEGYWLKAKCTLNQ